MRVEKPNLAFETWRNRIGKTLWILVLMIALIEILELFCIENIDPWTNGTAVDLRKYVVVPSCINFAVVFINDRIQQLDGITENVKNYVLLFSASALATVVAYVHYLSIMAISAFVFPIFMTIIFADQKMTRITTAVNMGLVTMILYRSSKLLQARYFYMDAFSAYAIMISAFLLSSVLIAYIKQNSDYVCASYNEQRELEEKTKRDPLTGLYNQKAFFEKLDNCVKMAQKNGTDLSCAIMDIDDFKAINDTYGHSAGNQALTTVSGIMREQFYSENKFVARYGGEEFGIVFQNSNKEQAYEQMEILRKRLKEVRYSYMNDANITVSIGVAQFQGDGKGSDLFDRADTALYEAKNNGKNQTVVE